MFPEYPLQIVTISACCHARDRSPALYAPDLAPHLLKAYIRHETVISRCQIRGGVHLDPDYVTEVCATPAFNQCIFYEDELTRD